MSSPRFFLMALLALLVGARAAPTLTLDRATSFALDQNPSLLALQSEVAASRVRLEGVAAAAEGRLAGREVLPTPCFGISYAEEGDPTNRVKIAKGILLITDVEEAVRTSTARRGADALAE